MLWPDHPRSAITPEKHSLHLAEWLFITPRQGQGRTRFWTFWIWCFQVRVRWRFNTWSFWNSLLRVLRWKRTAFIKSMVSTNLVLFIVWKRAWAVVSVSLNCLRVCNKATRLWQILETLWLVESYLVLQAFCIFTARDVDNFFCFAGSWSAGFIFWGATQTLTNAEQLFGFPAISTTDKE